MRAHLKEDTRRGGTIFRLRPFTSKQLVEELSISGSFARASDTLLVEYIVQGSLESINWPSALPVSHRCQELWRHTCFEFFFGIRGEPGYWEVNYCPSGGWNVYRFDNYRAGMREEATVGHPQCHVTEGTDFLSLSCTVYLNGIVADSSDLEAGVSCVIESTDGTTSYWAIVHQGTEPDFHNRSSFLAVLPGF
jgi:hypothetical protein